MTIPAVRAVTTTHRERLTWDEICGRFPERWVVLVDIAWVNETDFEFTTAAVIAHHTQRREASPGIKAARARNAEAGCFWTGTIRAPIPRFSLP